jgi:hypothetical protein
MKKSFLFVLGSLLITNIAFSMSPRQLTPSSPIAVQAIIKDLQKKGKVNLKQDEVTIYFAAAVNQRLAEQRLRDSLDQTISHQERDARRKEAITDLIAKKKDELLHKADDLKEEIREAQERRHAETPQSATAATQQTERGNAAADWHDE